MTERSGLVRQLWPLLIVQEIRRSIEFYRDRLGFALVGSAESGGNVFWCRLERDGSAVMLQQADEEDGPPEGRGRGVSLYFICDDAENMYTELTARGLRIDPPRVARYGMKQVFVPEPDGYSVCFESPTKDWAG